MDNSQMSIHYGYEFFKVSCSFLCLILVLASEKGLCCESKKPLISTIGFHDYKDSVISVDL